MYKIRRFFETSGIYFIGNILSKLIGIFLLPLYTSELSPQEFGTYDLVVTVISFFAPIAFFQIWDGMFRYSFDKHKFNEKYIVISNSFSIIGFGLIIYTVVFSITYHIFSFFMPWLIYFYGILVALQYQYTFISRVFLKNKLFAVTGFINSLINATINVILILKYDMGIESLFIASILGSLVQVTIIEINIKPLRNFRFNELKKQLQIDMIKFSLPLCIASVSYWMLSGYTKLSISHSLGNHANGLYAVANKFTSMITLLVSVFQYAWNEVAYLMTDDEKRVYKYEKSTEYIFKVIVIGSGIFMLIIKILFPYIIAPTYFDALLIVPLSLIGVAANAFANFIGTIFMAEKKTNWIFWTTIISSGINIVILWLFIPEWGLQGAVFALCFSFLSLAIFRIYALRKIFEIRFPLSNIKFILLLSIVVFIFFTIDNMLSLIITIFILCGVFVYSFYNIFIVLLRSVTKK